MIWTDEEMETRMKELKEKEHAMGTMLSQCIAYAALCHDRQLDKGNKPYILHPLHVMNECYRRYGYDPELMAIAVLHDVVEDAFTDAEYYNRLMWIRDHATERVFVGVQLLTKTGKETYEEYIERVAQNHDAIRVKMEDIRHNSDITRMKGVLKKDFERMDNYRRAYNHLAGILENWNGI